MFPQSWLELVKTELAFFPFFDWGSGLKDAREIHVDFRQVFRTMDHLAKLKTTTITFTKHLWAQLDEFMSGGIHDWFGTSLSINPIPPPIISSIYILLWKDSLPPFFNQVHALLGDDMVGKGIQDQPN